MDKGRVVADGTPASIVADLGGCTTVTFTDGDLDVSTLRGLPGVERVDRHGIEVRVAGRGPVLAHVGARLVALDRPALDLRAQLPSLEDRFVALTNPTVAS